MSSIDDDHPVNPVGCGFLILCAAFALGFLIWANDGFPKFWQ